MTSSGSPLSLVEQVIQIIRDDLNLDPQVELEDQTPLFGGELDLDSLDALLLVTRLEKRFGIKVPKDAIGPATFATPGTLARFVETWTHGTQAGDATSPATVPLEGLLARLPHADPFRFVTELRTLEPGEQGEGLWRVSGDEAFFPGHFPGHPVVPTVLLAEALAQLSGIVGAAAMPATATIAGRLAHIDVRGGIEVQPPADIVLRARLMNQVESLQQYDVRAEVDAEVCAEGRVALNMTADQATAHTQSGTE